MTDFINGGGILLREAIRAYRSCVHAEPRHRHRRLDGPSFSAAEKRVMPFILEGASNKEIAATLGIKMTSVKLYVRTLCRKLGVSNRTQAALALHKMNEI